MMKHAFWLLALAPIAASGDGLDEEWVEKDVAVARRVAAALPAEDAKVEDFLRKLGSSNAEEDRAIGFGGRRLRIALYGGYTTTWVTVIAWNDRVGPVEAFCYEGDEGIWTALKERVAHEYKGRDPAIEAKGLRARAGQQADPKGFGDARSKTLGPPAGIDPDPKVADAYRLLWSPFSDLAYGLMQGEGGDKPDGRVAMEALLAHEQGPALLEDVLRGPHPEGRLYAAEGLLRLGTKLGEQTARNIEWVRKSDVKIRVARGCELSWEPAAAPLDEMLKGH
jgi:hypothetical protein